MSSSSEAAGEKPFQVAVTDDELHLLRQKLQLFRPPDELDEAGWDYGVPLADIQRLVSRWKDGFEWRSAESKLNKMPQFTRDIEVDGFGTLNIHYIHQRSAVPNAIPILFLHGWPGHFMEVQNIISLLTASSSKHPSFHLVSISLPGYGFSQAPRKKGFSLPQYAEVSHKLMLALGYDEYVAQGGDWGSMIARELTLMYGSKHVKAWHTNIPLGVTPSLWTNPWLWLKHLITPYTAAERVGFERMQRHWSKGCGYFQEQATQPQTIGYSLSDSPVGLLAWLYEKLVAWTDDYDWDDDEILTWVSIYWFSRAGPAASIRIYYETRNEIGNLKYSSVPMGLSLFPKELVYARKSWIRAAANVVFESEHLSGGHFAAYEKPNELTDDIRRMFCKDGPAYGVVTGKNGYA